jgi:hypothetical protein
MNSENFAGSVNRIGAHRFSVEKLEGNSPLGRTRSRWEDNIKMNLKILPWMVWK